MKKSVFLILGIMFLGFISEKTIAQTSYKVVFDLTSSDPVNQKSLLGQMASIRETSPTAKMEAVIYSQGLSLVKNDQTENQEALKKLIADKNISFKVCAIAMKKQNVDKSQLTEGVQVVPDGIYEIVKRQQEGWGYIKVAR